MAHIMARASCAGAKRWPSRRGRRVPFCVDIATIDIMIIARTHACSCYIQDRERKSLRTGSLAGQGKFFLLFLSRDMAFHWAFFALTGIAFIFLPSFGIAAKNAAKKEKQDVSYNELCNLPETNRRHPDFFRNVQYDAVFTSEFTPSFWMSDTCPVFSCVSTVFHSEIDQYVMSVHSLWNQK